MMKRIAFVTPNYTGATLPIVKELLSLGYHVDFYLSLGVNSKKGHLQIEAVSLQKFRLKKGLHEIDPSNFQELYEYMGRDKFRMFYFQTSRPFKSIPVLRNIVHIWRSIEFHSIINHFRKQNYEMVNFVCNFDYNDCLFFHKKLRNTKIITSFHEVCNHWEPNFQLPSPLLSYLFKAKKEIVVHSQNSYRDILQYDNADKGHIHHINFGVFETFKTMKGHADFELPEKYVLFFGGIRPYKGLPYLLEAIKIDPSCLGDCKLIIAGGGYDESLDELKKMKDVIVLNRYITNEELIYLIEHCQFVVCPYTTMSQSGLPQTVFAFDKPIIVSDLDGFKEIVVDGKTGLLFTAKDASSLAVAIKQLTADNNLYLSMVGNIKNFGIPKKEFSWPFITKQYLNIMANN